MNDEEKIVVGFYVWLNERDDPKSIKAKSACAKGYISLHELIDQLRKYEMEEIKEVIKCPKQPR